MRIQEYISSGILEGFVLHTISEKERREVECMSHIYPEIKDELVRLQTIMEQFALKNASAPRPALKNKILLEIQSKPQQNANENQKNANVIPINRNKKINYFVVAAAAACIAVILFISWQNKKQSEKEIIAMKDAMEKMQDDYLTLETSIVSLNELNVKMAHELDMFRNPDFKTVFLTNVETQQERSLAIICWNKKDKSVMIAVDNMAQIPKGKQYQLWAMVEGKPMDMGVLPDGMTGNFIILENKVDNPQGFAITLEKDGGSPQPSLEDLYLAGNL